MTSSLNSVEEEKTPLLWRGSRNQNVHFLTDRYRDLEPWTLKEGIREVEIKVGEEELAMTGIFDIKMWERLKREISHE